MHPKRLAHFVQLIRGTTAGASVPSSEEVRETGVPSDGRTYTPGPGGTWLGLTPEGITVMNEKLRPELNKVWGSRVTEREVITEMTRLMTGALEQTDEQLGTALEAYDRKTEAQSEIRVLLPLHGVRVDGPGLQLGQLTLHPHSDTLREEIEQHVQEDIDGVPGPRYVEWALRDFTGTVAEFRMHASPLRALEEALRYADEVLPLLAILWGQDPYRQRQVGLGPSIPTTRIPAVILGDPEQLLRRAGAPLPNQDVLLDQETLDHLLLPRTLTILDQEWWGHSSTEFEQVFLRAMRWFANAHSQRDPANAVIGLTTALEVMFTPAARDDRGISSTIAEAVAFSLAPNAQAREHTYREVKALYALRSRITHGSTREVDDGALYRLRKYVFDSLWFLARHLDQWTAVKDMTDRLNTLKWTTPPGLRADESAS